MPKENDSVTRKPIVSEPLESILVKFENFFLVFPICLALPFNLLKIMSETF